MIVPNGWKEGRVRDLIKSLDSGVSVNSENDGNTLADYKILKTSCVSKGFFDFSKTKSVIMNNEISRLKEPVLADTIIISRMNTPTLVGANGYIESQIENIFLPDRLWQAKPKNKLISMRWLGFWFSSSHARYSLSATATGTSGSMKNITKPDVFNIKINIPPLPEQQKIAKILSTWDKAISTTEALIDNSKQQKKALMQQLLTGKKRLLDETGKVFEGGWEETKLSDSVSLLRSGLSRKLESENVGIAVIRSNNIGEKFTLNSNLKYWYKNDPQGANIVNYILDDGDILVNFINSMAQIGKSCIYKKIDKLDCIYTTNLLRLKVNTVIADSEYLFYLTKTVRYLSHIKSITKPAVNQASFTTKEFGSLKLTLPPLEEQKIIASVLASADKEIELLEQQLTDLKQEKKALMQQLLTGKRRVKINEKAVA